MRIFCRLIIFFSLYACLFINSVLAHEVIMHDGYVRETIPGTQVSSAYMTIDNHSEKAITLIGASTNVSQRVEIHEHIVNDGMMRMQQRQSLTIQAQSEVVLQPSGFHLMIFDLKQPLKQDDTISLTLHFSQQDDLVIQLPVHSIKKMQHHHH